MGTVKPTEFEELKQTEKSTTTSSGMALQAGMWQTPPIHIPNHVQPEKGPFKTDLTIYRSPEGTEKRTWWHGDDPRQDKPHNHPFSFESHVERGGYTEDRFAWVDGKVVKTTFVYRADGSHDGAYNRITVDDFHVVYDVLPDTVTHLQCGPAVEGNAWGYRDKETWEYEPATKGGVFQELFWQLNPFLRPKA